MAEDEIAARRRDAWKAWDCPRSEWQVGDRDEGPCGDGSANGRSSPAPLCRTEDSTVPHDAAAG